MTYCQVNKLPAYLVVLYTDSTVSTSESMSALQALLKHPLLSETLLLTVSLHDQLHIPISSYSLNIYIQPADEALQKAKQLTPKPRHDLSTLYT